MELYKKYRPTLFKHVIGQTEAVRALEDMLKRKTIPHAILFSGPSGCGKTTLARILEKKLGCHKLDFNEINAAEARGIDMVRDIKSRMGLAPAGGKCRIWLIDECQKLTTDAQSALLKILEDTPRHVYFLLATTDPGKLLKTIHTRCTEVRCNPIPQNLLIERMKFIVEKEGASVSNDVLERIAECCDNSARKALVLLHQVIGLPNEEEQLDGVLRSDSRTQINVLCQGLLDSRCKWPEMCQLIKNIEEEPETIRRRVLDYMSKVALGGGKFSARACAIIDVFRDHWYDCGKAGLITSCYTIVGNG